MVGYPAIGDRIGAFRIDAEVGRGGMGIVYRATQLTLNRPVALKILDPLLGANPHFIERFSHEAAILASVDSPHIIQIFDHGSVDGHLYLAMQYVAGGDLSELIRRAGPLPPRDAILVYSQVLDALADAHARGIVHRDVKPSNVLLRPDGGEPFAYLCDFGIAQTAETGLTRPGMIAGSWAFMSPERHSGGPATPRSDLYSAACVLWAALTGRNVYTGTDVQVAMGHLSAPVPQLPGSDPLVVSLNRLFWASLAKNPDERPDSAAEALVLARGPLAHAAGVPPLEVSRPDSGIFRPVRVPTPGPGPAGEATAAHPGPLPASFATIAMPVPPASGGAPPDAPGPAAPTPVTSPPAPPRPDPLAWLLGAGALVLTVTLVFAILTWSGALGRATPAAPATTGSRPSPARSPAGTPTASPDLTAFECSDGSIRTDLAQCPAPSGRAALTWLYLSLDADSCAFKDYRASTGAYDCTIATRGLIRYRFWLDADEARTHYEDKYGDPTPLLLDGVEVGDLYRNDQPVDGTYTLSGLWLDGHFSFSTEATSIAGREELLRLVRLRALAELTGQPLGADPTPGRLG